MKTEPELTLEWCDEIWRQVPQEARKSVAESVKWVIEQDRARLQSSRDRSQGGLEECPRVEQTRLHNPPESRGNCFQAVLAGLLRIPIECIPEFDGKPWQHEVNNWLRQFGLQWLPLDGNDYPGACLRFGIQGTWHEVAEKSPRGVGHSCAAKDGSMQWDPHPSESGLDEPIWWHGVFVAMRPWEAARSHLPAIKTGEVVDFDLGFVEACAILAARPFDQPTMARNIIREGGVEAALLATKSDYVGIDILRNEMRDELDALRAQATTTTEKEI